MPKVMPGYFKAVMNTFHNEDPGPSSAAVPPRFARKRGRPRGNPKPLNDEQKKLRNALYERERRNEASEAMTQLQDVMGLKGRVSNNEIISRAIQHIAKHNENPPEDLDTLRSQNQLLEKQIAQLEIMLASEDHYDDNSDDDDGTDDNEDLDDEEEKNQHEVESTEEHHQPHAEFNYTDVNDSFYDNPEIWNLLGIE